MKYTDSEMLDYLDKLTKETGYSDLVILRNSTTGRGWRLHTTTMDGGVSDVRSAIEYYIVSNGGLKNP